VRDRIFNPFFTTRATGTGLGLAIVHRIVDAHGGQIVIEDGKPTGARIELCLPIAKKP
jgi:signal transduction histidine kinase